MKSYEFCLSIQTDWCIPCNQQELYIEWILFLLQESCELVTQPHSTSWGTHRALAGHLGPADWNLGIKSWLKIINQFATGRGLYLCIFVYKVKHYLCIKKTQISSPFG